MHPLARRRCLAHLTDCAGYLGIAAATVPVGVVIATTTDLGSRPLYAHLVSIVPPVIATVVAARAESGPRRATWGKRRQGLEVVGADGGAPTPREALVRNASKILVPWQIGHMTAISAAWGGFETGDALAYGSSAAVYALIGVYAWTGLRGSGRGPHDRLAGTHVVATATAVA
jgi:uncharacterized RDD family membrane protein YckC